MYLQNAHKILTNSDKKVMKNRIIKKADLTMQNHQSKNIIHELQNSTRIVIFKQLIVS